MKRPSNKYPVEYGVRRIYFNQKLKFEDRSLSVEAGVNLAFYGYLTALNKDKSRPPVVYLWVNPETGEIEEVAFLLWLTRNKELLSVPPRNFTLYEDILKKTVKFEVPHGIFDPNTDGYDRTRKPEDGIYYEFDIKFPAPAAGEPDFLALPAEASAQGK